MESNIVVNIVTYKAIEKSSLKTHVKSIHDGVKYSCEYCDYKATRKDNLQEHVKSIHDGVNKVVSIVTLGQPGKHH